MTIPRFLPLVLAVSLVATIPPADAGRDHEDRDLPLRESSRRQLELAFPDPSRPGTVDVDNVWGPVTVRATDTRVVSVTVVETIHAADRTSLAAARTDARLDTTPDPASNTVRLYADSPGRCGDRGPRRFGQHGWRDDDEADDDDRDDEEQRRCRRRQRAFDDDYEVHYALTVEVPRDADVIASTVLDGDVVAEGLSGRYRVANVNGDVELRQVRGPRAGASGTSSAHTVNGELSVELTARPTTPLSFGTVNGDLDLAFPADLAADFSFEMLNGEIYSDFPYVQQPTPAGTSRRDGGRYVYRSGRPTIRIGTGGPAVAVSTVNGDVTIRRHGR